MVTPQAVPSQLALPIVGTGQAVHELPQVSTLLFDTHSPPQLWKPSEHRNPPSPHRLASVPQPVSALPASTTVLPSRFTSCVAGSPSTATMPASVTPALSTAPVSTSVAPASPAPAGVSETERAVVHAIRSAGASQCHDLARPGAPCLVIVVSDCRRPRQPGCGISIPQTRPSQVANPPGGTGQAAQEEPQLNTLSFGTQSPAHGWKPALHGAPQRVPSQLATPFAGAGHTVHETPHLATSLSEKQRSLQRCIPKGQSPPHDVVLGAHVPRHSFVPAGQSCKNGGDGQRSGESPRAIHSLLLFDGLHGSFGCARRHVTSPAGTSYRKRT